MAPQDNRRHRRAPVGVAAALTLDDGTRIEGMAENISFGGAYFKAREAVRVGACGTFALVSRHDPEQRPIRFSCEVVRADPGGLGLKLTDTDPDGFERFAHYMIMEMDNPASILEEIRISPGLRVATDEGLKEALE